MPGAYSDDRLPWQATVRDKFHTSLLRSVIFHTIAVYYCIRRLRQRVHRKLCRPNFQTRFHTTVQANHQTAKCLTIQAYGFKYPRIAARSPSPLPKKEHDIASGLGNYASERCCAQPLALPLDQSCIQHTDVTRASCPGFP